MTTSYAPRPRSTAAGSKLSGTLSAAMAAGLATTHLAIYTTGYLNTPDVALSTYLLSGVAVASVAFVFAAAAGILAWHHRLRAMRRTLRVVCWVAAAVLSLQALAIGIAEPGLLVRPAGPGPWSLIGGPAFAIFAWRSRVRPTS